MRAQVGLALVCIALVLALFAAMWLAAETGHVEWLAVVSALDFAAILGFVAFAPERWRS